MEPYRALVIVPKDLPDYQESHCPACNALLALTSKNNKSTERFCLGRTRWFHFFRRCEETRPHIHQKCGWCKASWIVGTKREAKFSEG